jgi:type IV secretory pathway VirD2 relaxase
MIRGVPAPHPISVLEDEADSRAFLARDRDDRHQFRFIVTPEDAAECEASPMTAGFSTLRATAARGIRHRASELMTGAGPPHRD